ncbi:UDP-N-acetylglucosamine 4,6-dehydratase (inverting) [Pelagibacterales bacterium SAG-MED38]|nr:UDP-N-acetylglucosamine 4,6-dehydratase (inverting) [Pelagibacterales bacterium SAG-MED38]
MYKNKTILITGGTGSFGRKFTLTLLKKFKDIKKLIIFSRDELKQFEMSNQYKNTNYYNKLRFFIGDIRDRQRLDMALRDVDIVIHAAALKHVPSSEYNPFETIKTNVIGTQNVIESCIENNVAKLISLSTDKASSPVNLYGASKLLADKISVSTEYIKGKTKITSAVVRYGNVMASRGSIIPILLSKKNQRTINLTDKNMTRFNISLDEAIDLVLLSLRKASGGEIFVPKLKSYRLIDVAKTIAPNAKLNFIGIRPGEKIHEEMISFTESANTIEYKNYFIILPSFRDYKISDYIKKNGGKKIAKRFSYSSDKNKKYLTTSELKKLIQNIQN